YPDLGFQELCSFLSEREYRRLLRVPLVMVLPIGTGGEAQADWLLGVGLARVLNRDLMLVPQISVRGPEDTGFTPLDAMPPDSPVTRRHILIGGQAHHDDEGFSAELHVRFPDGRVARRGVRSRALPAFLQRCARAALAALDLPADDEAPEGWQFGRPGSLENLLEY